MATVVNKMYSTIGGDIPYSFEVPLICNNVLVQNYDPARAAQSAFVNEWLPYLLEADSMGKSLYLSTESDTSGVPYNDENGNLIKKRAGGMLKTNNNNFYYAGMLFVPYNDWDKEKNTYASYFRRYMDTNISVTNLQNYNQGLIKLGVTTHCTKNNTYHCHGIGQSTGGGYSGGTSKNVNNNTETSITNGTDGILYASASNPRNISYGFYPEEIDKLWFIIHYVNNGSGSYTTDSSGNRTYTQDPYIWTISKYVFNLTHFLFAPYGLYTGNPYYHYPFDEE